MAEKKSPTYAANTRQLAKALGLKAKDFEFKTKAQLFLELSKWIARPDFPPKEKRGWRLAEAQVWYRNFRKRPKDPKTQRPKKEHPTANLQHTTSNELPAQEKPGNPEDLFLSDEDKLKGRLRRNQDAYFNPDKYPTKLAKWEVDELRANGMIPGGVEEAKPAAPAEDQSDLPLLVEKVTTQKAILPELQRHYRGRLVNEIRPQNISDWKRGQKLPDPNAPCAPQMEGNYFYIAQWIAWFDRWILPYWQIQPEDTNGNGALFSPAQMERMRRDDEREALLHNQFVRDRDRGRWIPVADAQNQRRGQLKVWLGFMQRKLETEGVKELTEWLVTHLKLDAPQKLAVQEYLARFMQEKTDSVYAEGARLAASDPETEMARQLVESQ